MSDPDQVLPSTDVTQAAPGLAFAATGIPETVVFLGPASAGPYTPQLIGAGNLALLKSTFKTGPLVKEAAYGASKVARKFVAIRLPTVAVPGAVHDVTVTRSVSSDFTYTTSGTVTDGADVVIKFTNGGTTGIAGITYNESLDGGVTWASHPLGTATSITVRGRVLALGSGKVITTNDVITWWQTPPSGSILTQLPALALASTGSITLSGTPADGYSGVIFEMVKGCTVGVAGGTYRYSLDGGSLWSPVTALGTATTVALLDGTEASGITATLGAGDLTAGDSTAAACSPPAYDVAGVTAALTALRTWGGSTWTWLRFAGAGITATQAASIATLIDAFDAAKLPTWGVADARDRVAGESLTAWEARVAEDYASYTSTRLGIAGGTTPLTCPITARRDRRSAMLACLPRAMSLPLHTDWAEFARGPLADADILDATGEQVEYDANATGTLNAMGMITLRRWPGYAGVYPTKAALMGPAGDIKRVPLRRVMNVAVKLYQQILQLPICRHFRVLKSAVPKWNAAAGDLYPPDLNGLNTEARRVLQAGLVDVGDGPYVSGFEFSFDATPISLGGGSYRLTSSLKLVALIYVDEAHGEVQFVSAQLSGIGTGTEV